VQPWFDEAAEPGKWQLALVFDLVKVRTDDKPRGHANALADVR
jgi:hypothetical protein